MVRSMVEKLAAWMVDYWERRKVVEKVESKVDSMVDVKVHLMVVP